MIFILKHPFTSNFVQIAQLQLPMSKVEEIYEQVPPLALLNLLAFAFPDSPQPPLPLYALCKSLRHDTLPIVTPGQIFVQCSVEGIQLGWQVIYEMVELREVDTARTMLRQAKAFQRMRKEEPDRYT